MPHDVVKYRSNTSPRDFRHLALFLSHGVREGGF